MNEPDVRKVYLYVFWRERLRTLDHTYVVILPKRVVVNAYRYYVLNNKSIFCWINKSIYSWTSPISFLSYI